MPASCSRAPPNDVPADAEPRRPDRGGRRGWWTTLLVTFALLTVASSAWLGGTEEASGRAGGIATDDVAAVVGPPPSGPPGSERPLAGGATTAPGATSRPSTVASVGPAPTAPLAELAGLEIRLPTATPVVVGFHEAARASAIEVTPTGVLTEDRNTTRTDLPPDVPGGTPYLVLTSRGRSAGPTSAIDVVMEPGDPVLAPVTGTVVDVRLYLLYGSHPDLRIELVPDDRPDARLVMIHVDGAAVAIGDRVVGGVTPVAATARLFPFGSHIDRETEPDRFPHVHIELQPIDAPRPGDDQEDEGDGDEEGGVAPRPDAQGAPAPATREAGGRGGPDVVRW